MGRLPLRRTSKRKHFSELLVLQEGVGKLISVLFAFPEGKTFIQLVQPLRISRLSREKKKRCLFKKHLSYYFENISATSRTSTNWQGHLALPSRFRLRR